MRKCTSLSIAWTLPSAAEYVLLWICQQHDTESKRFPDKVLLNDARRALVDYLAEGERKESAYIFTSQRQKARLSKDEVDGWRWTENGIHHWWQQLKRLARAAEFELIKDVDFHDLRHDFGHRARTGGWELEEVAYYLGHITKSGTSAIQTTIRYTQVSREQAKRKLKNIKG